MAIVPVPGRFYFLKDEFFELMDDPYLKSNYDATSRPHYCVQQDERTGLYWMAPVTTRVPKFEQMIAKKRAQGKQTDAIQIVMVRGEKRVLLFQDMFPIRTEYIDNAYIRGGQPVCITNPSVLKELENVAAKLIILLRRGVKFTPTAPDVLRIEQLMIAELQRTLKDTLADRITAAKEAVRAKKQVAALKRDTGRDEQKR